MTHVQELYNILYLLIIYMGKHYINIVTFKSLRTDTFMLLSHIFRQIMKWYYDINDRKYYLFIYLLLFIYFII